MGREPYTTASLRVTGYSKQGTPVVVFAHEPNYFSQNPDAIRDASRDEVLRFYRMARNWRPGAKLPDLAGETVMPKVQFYRLLEREDSKSVFVIDYKDAERVRGEFSMRKALKFPITIPFFGGEEYAEQYLHMEKKIKGYGCFLVAPAVILRDEPIGSFLIFDGCIGDCESLCLGTGSLIGRKQKGLGVKKRN